MDTAIDLIPDDILAEIFKETIAPYFPCGCMLPVPTKETNPSRSPPEPRIFGRVCKRWRRVTRSTPLLWRLFIIETSDPVGSDVLIAEHKDRIRLAADVPLILVISTGSSQMSRLLYHPCLEFIHRHTRRWSQIYARSYWWIDIFFAIKPSTFSQLTKLATNLSGSSLNAALPPTISTLGYQRTRFKPDDIPWGNLTTFEGLVMSMNDMVHVLQNSPRLVHIRFITMIFAGDDPVPLPPFPNLPRVLPELITLDVMNASIEVDTSLILLRHIETPNLKLLRWSFGMGYDPRAARMLGSILARLNCTLDALFICVTMIWEEGLDPLAEAAEDLREALPTLSGSHIVILVSEDANSENLHSLWPRCGDSCRVCGRGKGDGAAHDCTANIVHLEPTADHEHSRCMFCTTV